MFWPGQAGYKEFSGVRSRGIAKGIAKGESQKGNRKRGIAKGESQKGTFYFTRVAAAVNLCPCQEPAEHPEVALFPRPESGQWPQ